MSRWNFRRELAPFQSEQAPPWLEARMLQWENLSTLVRPHASSRQVRLHSATVDEARHALLDVDEHAEVFFWMDPSLAI